MHSPPSHESKEFEDATLRGTLQPQPTDDTVIGKDITQNDIYRRPKNCEQTEGSGQSENNPRDYPDQRDLTTIEASHDKEDFAEPSDLATLSLEPERNRASKHRQIRAARAASPYTTKVVSLDSVAKTDFYTSQQNGKELSNALQSIHDAQGKDFDPSDLDHFLAKQAEPRSDKQPTSTELAQTQIWGHIDPRVSWPKKSDEDWLIEKRKEIDARGGRKANFGKHLTAQVRREKTTKGWHMHQTSDPMSEHDWNQRQTFAEELLNAKDCDDLIPRMRDGHLVMMEKHADKNGKKRKTVKYYSVL